MPASAPAPKSQIKSPTNGKFTENNVLTVEAIHRLYKDGIFLPYEHNRGDIGISTSRVKEIAEDFDPRKLGSATVADLENGTYRFTDFHHRIEGIALRIESGSMTSAELAHEFPLIVVSKRDHLVTYQGQNNAKGHTGANKITNPDLLVGRLMSELEDISDLDVKPDQKLSLSDLCFAVDSRIKSGQGLRDLELDEVWPFRNSMTNELLNVGVDRRTYNLSPRTETLVTNAMKAFKRLANYAAGDKASTPAMVWRLLHSSNGFLQAFLFDHVTEGGLGGFSKRQTGLLARSIRSKAARLIDASATVARRNRQTLDTRTFTRL